MHELAHALGIGYEQYGRERAEVLVDCATYIVCGSVGLDVGGESIPYIAGWGEDGALDAIREYAETIDTIARRIEDALDRARHATHADRAADLADDAPARSVGAAAAPMVGRAGRRTARRNAYARDCRRPGSPGTGRMQPPTEPTRRDHSAAAAPRGDEDDLYRRHHRDLQRAVARAVNAPRELIEDACQTAWTILLRRQPDRASIFAWLTSSPSTRPTASPRSSAATAPRGPRHEGTGKPSSPTA